MIFVKYVFIVAFSVPQVISESTFVPVQLELETILNSARQFIETLPPHTYEVEAVDFISNDSLVVPGEAEQMTRFTVFASENHYQTIGATYVVDEMDEFTTNSEMDRYWDGTRQWGWTNTVGRKRPGANVRHSEAAYERLVFSKNIGAFLEGRFQHNHNGNWVEILQDEASIELSPTLEAVDGFQCYVITADTDHGHYTLWIDPKNGFNIRQASISVGSDDLAWGIPLKEDSRPNLTKRFEQLEMEISDVTIENIDGYFISTGGTHVEKYYYDDGSVSIVKKVVQRTNIQMNPDFEALGAFQIPYPEGTLVDYWFEDGSRFKYTWQGGRLIRKIEHSIIAEIDNAMDEILAEASLLGNTTEDFVPASSISMLPKVAREDAERPSTLVQASIMSVLGVAAIGLILFIRRLPKKAATHAHT